MDHSKKLDFIHKMARLGLEHVKMPVQNFDSGGMVQTQAAPSDTLLGGPDSRGTNQEYFSPEETIGGGVGKFLGLQSDYGAAGADIQKGTNVAQLNNSFDNANGALGAQAGLANTLTPQAAQATNQQRMLAQQYQNTINGIGPNVALNELHQATAANTANQAALMASQRGASANPGMIARQAAMQGGANQQADAASAATLQAQQQIAAQQGLGQLSNQQIGQTQGAVTGVSQATQGEQNILQNSNSATNNANVGMQSNINTTNAQTAATNASGIGGMIGGAITAVGSLFGGAGAEGGEITKEGFKKPQMFAQGGSAYLKGNPLLHQDSDPNGPQSYVAQWLNNSGPSSNSPNVQLTPFSVPDNSQEKKDIAKGLQNAFGSAPPSATGSSGDLPGVGLVGGGAMPAGSVSGAGAGDSLMGGAEMAAAEGGMVPALVSPGERYLTPKEAKKVAKGEKAPLKAGEKIPGKPKFPGNDYRNDIVPKKLKEGGIVIPNKILQSKNPGHEAKKFVQAVLAKQGLKGKAK